MRMFYYNAEESILDLTIIYFSIVNTCVIYFNHGDQIWNRLTTTDLITISSLVCIYVLHMTLVSRLDGLSLQEGFLRLLGGHVYKGKSLDF